MESVFRSHGGMVWRAVLSMAAGDRSVADEATAEAFARMLAYRDGVREPVPWVFRTAFGVAARELGRQTRITDAAMHELPVADTSDLAPELTEMLGMLSPEQRVAVFLHYVADLPVSEVARLTGSSATAVKVRLHRARRSLRESMLAAEGNVV